MRIKSEEWLNFKSKFMSMAEVLEHESQRFDLPDETENFEISVDGCVVHPVFIKKPEEFRVNYDFTLCNTKIRTLSLSLYKGTARIEMTLKNETQIQETV